MKRVVGLLRFPPIGAMCLIGGAVPLKTQDEARRTRSELRKMVPKANTAEQYQTLAHWFREQETEFCIQGEKRNQVYERFKTTTRPKVPTTADHARSWRDHYAAKADQAGLNAAKYEAQLLPGDRTGVRHVPSLGYCNEKSTLDEIDRLDRQAR